MATTSLSSTLDATGEKMTREELKVIFASSLGTAFEWYDFFLFGALAPVIGAKFFGDFNETTRNIFALLTFAAGFVVRPIGALLFARFGDLLGRKSIFLVTLVIMGGSTVAVGLVPTSDQIGLAAPVLILTLRILQGLAISGEFGGAVIYVAEHSPPRRRGFYTGWIPATVGLSIAFSLGVLLCVELATGAAAFRDWGWRLPFIVSVVPLGVSIWIRLKLHESPVFLKMKADGGQSRAPIAESFGRWKNARLALIALFGLIAPHSMVGYVATFYTLLLLTTALKVDSFTANTLFVMVMLGATFLCVFFSWLSDKVGRKPVVIAGFALAIVTYFPIFHAISLLTNPALAEAQRRIEVRVVADPRQCSLQFNPAGTARFTSDCDRAKLILAQHSVAYTNSVARAGAPTRVIVQTRTLEGGTQIDSDLAPALLAAGYPSATDARIVKVTGLADLASGRVLMLLGLLLLLASYGQMTQGPSAAAMVELFPTRIRYTAMSLPFQIGTGWFGGLLPAVMIAINAQTGNIFSGLWYPITVAGVGIAICGLFLPETRGRDLDHV